MRWSTKEDSKSIFKDAFQIVVGRDVVTLLLGTNTSSLDFLFKLQHFA
jgi:hypothetical protein